MSFQQHISNHTLQKSNIAITKAIEAVYEVKNRIMKDAVGVETPVDVLKRKYEKSLLKTDEKPLCVFTPTFTDHLGRRHFVTKNMMKTWEELTPDEKRNATIHEEVDTEYRPPEFEIIQNPAVTNCRTRLLTSQVTGVFDVRPTIYDNQDGIPCKRHHTATEDADFLQWIIEYIDADFKTEKGRVDREYMETVLGVDFTLADEKADAKAIADGKPPLGSSRKIDYGKTLTINLYAYFMIADLWKLIDPDGWLEKAFKKACVDEDMGFKSRLTISTNGKASYELPRKCWLKGELYNLNLQLTDTGALLGSAFNLQSTAAALNVPMPAKDLMDDYKTRMDEGLVERPNDFDEYALGDNVSAQMLENYDEILSGIYDEIGLSDYHDPVRALKPTVGSTTNGVITAQQKDWVEFPVDASQGDWKAFVKTYMTPNSADALSKHENRNVQIFAKTAGGRAWNARPLTSKLLGALCDIDIGGAYASAMRSLIFPIGKSRQDWFDKHNGSTINGSEFFKRFRTNGEGKNIYPDGLWEVSFDAEELAYPQDLYLSWVNVKRNARFTKDENDEWKKTMETDARSGQNSNRMWEVKNGICTSDFKDLMDNAWKHEQHKDFMDKMQVKAFIYYLESDRCETATEFYETVKTNEHAWLACSFGDFIDALAKNRKKYAKKSPQNEMYKLLGNTVYGVSVSSFFTNSNMIFGSNITARVRAFMWTLEKSLGLVQSITDGGIFDLLRVLFATRYETIAPHKLVYAYQKKDRELHLGRICKFAPLGGAKSLKIYTTQKLNTDTWEMEPVFALEVDGVKLTLAASTAWVDEKAMEHVKNFFSNVMFLKHCNFKLEMKSFATKAAFTGSAHYMMNQADSKWNVKMRGVEAKKPVQAFGVDLSFLSDYEKESPAFQAMFRILENPDLVKIGTPYVKHKMLKLAEYTRRLTALKNKQVELRALEGGDFDDSNSDAQINRMMNECHTVIKRGCGLSPGESYFAVVIPRLFLAGVFNYRTQHQFEQWCKFNESLLGKYGVGIELFYSDVFGNVRYMDMLHDVDTALFNGVGCKGKKISEFFRNKTRYIKDVYNNPFYIERKKAVAQMKERCASLAFMSENDILDWWETENLEEESDILDVENDVENDDF